MNKSSYDPIILPNIKAYQATCKTLGAPSEVMDIGTEAIPKELEWGEVLLSLFASPRACADVRAACSLCRSLSTSARRP